jgi:hypothetical protein
MDIQKFKGLLGKGVRPKAPEAESESPPKPAETRHQKLESYVLFLLLQGPEHTLQARLTELTSLSWTNPEVKKLLQDLMKTLPGKNLNQAVTTFPSDQQQLVFELSTQPQYLELFDQLDFAAEWQKVLTDLRQEDIRTRLDTINSELEKLERAGTQTPEDEAKQTTLLQEIVQLQKQLASHSVQSTP